MSCGQILSALRTKWNRIHSQLKLWLWRNKSGYFYCKHCCIGCEYFDGCFAEFMGDCGMYNEWADE